MYVHDLFLISLKNLGGRFGRTLFLSAGVLLGTGLLFFVVSLIQGASGAAEESIRRSVEEVEADQEEILLRHQELATRLERVAQETPVHRIELLPKEGAQSEIKEKDVARLMETHGDRIERVVKIAFLFPMFAEVHLVDFEIDVAGEKIDLARMSRGQRIPVSVYGVDPEEMEGKILGPDDQPSPFADQFRYEEGQNATPVVLPAEWMGFVKNMGNEDMRERLRNILTQAIFFLMQDPKNRERLTQRLGQNFLTESFVKSAVEDAIEQIYEKLRPEAIQSHFQILLYPGLTKEDEAIRATIVGASRHTPFTGITVPTPYIARWHREHFQANASVFSRLFSGEPEVNYSKVILYGKDLDSTVALVDALSSQYLVQSEVDQARRLAEEVALVKGEEKDLAGKREALEKNATQIRQVVGAAEDGAWLVGLLVFLLAGTGIANGLTLSVIEQAKRIGILRAVGARRIDILVIFLAEAFVIGVLGSSLGVLGGLGAIQVADLRLPELLADLPYPPETLFSTGADLALAVIGGGVLVSLVAGIPPALKGSWIQPVEVLKD